MTTTTDELGPKRKQALELTQDPEVGLDTSKLAARMGITRNAAAGHLRGLREAGLIAGAPARRGRPPRAASTAPVTPDTNGRAPSIADEVRDRVRRQNIAERDAAREMAEHAAREASALAAVADELDAAVQAMDAAHGEPSAA